MWCSTGTPRSAAIRQMGSSRGSLARRLAASLMPIMPASRQRSELGRGVGGEVGIDDAVAPNAGGMRSLQGEQAVVAVLDVGGDGK